MSGGNIASRLLGWWLGELRSLLGPEAGGSAAPLTLVIREDDASLAVRRRRKLVEIDTIELAEDRAGAARRLRRLLRRLGIADRRATLLLPRRQVLDTAAEVPTAAADNLREVLAFEMDRHTPFRPEDVVFDFRVAGSDPDLERLRIDLQASRKRDVQNALEFARGLGLEVVRVAGADGRHEHSTNFNLLPEDERPRRSRLFPRLLAVATAAVLILAAANLVAWFDRQEALLAESEARAAELRRAAADASTFRDRTERLGAVAGHLVDRKQARPLMVALVDDVTRRLPDQHWLVSFEIRDGALKISGYSDDPSGLLRLIEQSPHFAEARFSAPVTIDPRVEKERFSIVANALDLGAEP